jgi:integrase
MPHRDRCPVPAHARVLELFYEPLSTPPFAQSFWEKLGRACQDAGIAHVSPHNFRHSCRAWLDELGTPITVQQRAMRHGDIRVTMNYGDALGEGLREASARVAAKAIPP